MCEWMDRWEGWIYGRVDARMDGACTLWNPNPISKPKPRATTHWIGGGSHAVQDNLQGSAATGFSVLPLGVKY